MTFARTGSIPSARFSRNRFLSPVCLLVLGLLLHALPAAAQFNGPGSITGGGEMNRPVNLTVDPSLLYPPTQDTIIEPGDSITVHLYGEADYQPTVRIDADGNGELPLIGIVHLGDLTSFQAGQLVSEKLLDAGMFRDPQATVSILDGTAQSITLVGEVHGVQQIVGKRRLLDVISQAGGLPSTASRIIAIDRPGVPEPIVIDLGTDPLRSRMADVPVFPGDTIVVSRLGVVYVLGAFKTAGVLTLNSYGPLTLIEATTLSGGGVQFQAKSKDLRIIRTVGNRRTVAVYDIKRVLNGQDPDPILQPNDIVYLASSPLKSFLVNGTLSTILGLVSFAISIEAIR